MKLHMTMMTVQSPNRSICEDHLYTGQVRGDFIFTDLRDQVHFLGRLLNKYLPICGKLLPPLMCDQSTFTNLNLQNISVIYYSGTFFLGAKRHVIVITVFFTNT